MHPSLASLLILLGPVAMAQPAFEREAPLGPMGVGYTDTLLHAAGVEYSGFGYTGPAPLFVQHWFPMDAKNRSAPLSYGALRERQLPDGLASVYAALHAEMERSFIATDLSGSYPDHDPIDYGKSSLAEVLEQVMHTATRSQRAAPARRSDAPVIIYHHGSQGSSDENVAMAEYFASRGYDLVSANFHWPHADAPYGMEGFTNDPGALRAVLRYAHSLTTSDSVFFIGHSWGAQMGWYTLHSPGPVRAFVSMETTLETKTDTNEIKDKWAWLYDALATRGEVLPIPVLLLANTQRDAPFAFLAGRSTSGLHAASIQPFDHESYTSAYFLRYFHRDRFPQPDTAAMAQQLARYGEHLSLIDAFFHAVRSGGEFPREHFREAFFLNRTTGERKP